MSLLLQLIFLCGQPAWPSPAEPSPAVEAGPSESVPAVEAATGDAALPLVDEAPADLLLEGTTDQMPTPLGPAPVPATPPAVAHAPAVAHPPADEAHPPVEPSGTPSAHEAPQLPDTRATADEGLPDSIGPDWLSPFVLEQLTSAPGADPAESEGVLPTLSDWLVRGPEAASRRLGWFILGVLAAWLSGRLSSRRRPGTARRNLERIRAVSRAIAAVSGLGLVLVLVPLQWLPWVGLVAGSAAVAVGWSLRPYAADALAGVLLGIGGRLGTGGQLATPLIQGEVVRPGPFSTVLRSESGELHTIANRHFLGSGPRHRPPDRRSTTVSLVLPTHTSQVEGLRAIRSAVAMLPWVASDVEPIIVPVSSGTWEVQVHLLGRHSPVDMVAAVLPGLVAEELASST